MRLCLCYVPAGRTCWTALSTSRRPVSVANRWLTSRNCLLRSSTPASLLTFSRLLQQKQDNNWTGYTESGCNGWWWPFNWGGEGEDTSGYCRCPHTPTGPCSHDDDEDDTGCIDLHDVFCRWTCVHYWNSPTHRHTPTIEQYSWPYVRVTQQRQSKPCVILPGPTPAERVGRRWPK